MVEVAWNKKEVERIKQLYAQGERKIKENKEIPRGIMYNQWSLIFWESLKQANVVEKIVEVNMKRDSGSGEFLFVLKEENGREYHFNGFSDSSTGRTEVWKVLEDIGFDKRGNEEVIKQENYTLPKR